MEPSETAQRPRRMNASFGASRRLFATVLVAVALAACTGSPAARTDSPTREPASPGASAGPETSARPSGSSGPAGTPSASGVGTVTTAEIAFRVVQSRSPWFDKVARKDPKLIGQGSWWDAKPGDNGSWLVTVQVGWGDCQAGCINHHTWLWAVASDGTAKLVSESGSSIPQAERDSLAKTATQPGLGGIVVAGPVCPVVRPGESGCDDKPVAGAPLEVQDKDGKAVWTMTTDASGLFRVPLPAGTYTLVAKPRDGLMGTPSPQPVTVASDALTDVLVSYDTGIR